MLINYLKTTFRNLLRNRVSSSINILGLSIGMVSCLLIVLYVQHGLSFDDFHMDKDRIFRVALIETQGSSQDRSATNYYGVPQTLSEELPDVESFCTLHSGSGVMRSGDVQHRETQIYHVDPNFLEFFGYQLLDGDPESVLKQPQDMLITSEAALRYFGSEDPLGQEMVIDGNDRYTIVGMIESPDNSHFQFDFILNNEKLLDNRYRNDNGIWNWSNFYSYVKIGKDLNYKEVESKFPDVLNPHISDDQTKWNQFLQPIDEIALYSNLDWEMAETGNGKILYTLLFIAFLVLGIAWVNYVNLSTAQAADRSKEVGIRKVSGASRYQLIFQFLFQSVVLNLLSLALAVVLCQLILPSFTNLVGSDLSGLSTFFGEHFLAIGGLFLVGVIVSGLYPAFVLSGFKPVKVLKGKLVMETTGISLRKSLTVFQFCISIILIAVTLMIHRQLDFMRSQNLGFESHQKLALKGPSVTDSTFQSKTTEFKNALSVYSGINQVAISSTVPSVEMSGIISGFRRKEVSPDQGILMSIMGADEDYASLYQIPVISGRDFDFELDKDARHVLLNRSGAQALGYESPEAAAETQIAIGTGEDNIFTVVGVLDDYHHNSLRENIDPVCILYGPYWVSYFTIDLHTADIANGMEFVREKYASFFPGNPFEYFFVDESFARQYEADERLGGIMMLFSSLAIFVACLGLFGLTTFTARKRSKEIGIRKVLGAEVEDILRLITRDFIGVLGVAVIISVPLILFAVKKWLTNYAYQVNIDWTIFPLSAGVVLLVALITMSYQGYKSATSHPVKALREE